ncbi:MAG: YebC/PmpR family DNA-binding transcriptional regulator [Kiritimatiellae bacterium]|nr:YebC/PmpR family DNA-binding transcriptional regulator [Kiritimatiellia bacterium]
MSGHSKWANIKHKKAAADAKKGKVFSRIAREIMVAAKNGGGDLDTNVTLRTLVQKGRAANMPAENIDRAIKKGTGELAAEVLEERMFEGFAAGGVAIIVHALTDNHNRTTAEVRLIFNKQGANLAQLGAVSRGFKRKGRIIVEDSAVPEDRLMEIVLEAGAEDMVHEDGQFVVTTEPSAYPAVADAIQKANIPTEESQVTMLPDLWVTIHDKHVAQQVMRLVETLEELDDVQDVYTNMDVDEAILKDLEG